jgi:hypothetical protein
VLNCPVRVLDHILRAVLKAARFEHPTERLAAAAGIKHRRVWSRFVTQPGNSGRKFTAQGLHDQVIWAWYIIVVVAIRPNRPDGLLHCH